MSIRYASKRAERKASQRFSLNHLPVPVSGLAASHRELRLVLGALRVVAHDPVAPPAGNGLWAIARRAVADLDRALVRHMGEPHPLPVGPQTPQQPSFPPSAAVQADLEGQHTALVVLAVALSAQLGASREGHPGDWLALRALVSRVIDRLERHLDQEERLVPQGQLWVPPGPSPGRGPSPEASDPRRSPLPVRPLATASHPQPASSPSRA